MNLREYLKKHVLIADGAMGTYYSSIIKKDDELSELGNLTNPELIENIHKEYIAAGARLLRTNTFAANKKVLQVDKNMQETVIRTACAIAKKAVKESGDKLEKDEKIWILGDIGPITEDVNSSEADVLEEYKFISDIFLDEGLDGIHFETMSNTKYIEKLVPYIRAKSPDAFILLSFSVNKNGYSADGISASRLIERTGQIEGIDACGLNCGIGSGHMYQLLKKISFPADRFVYSSPNAGYPEQMQNRMVFIDNALYFAENMNKITALGINIIGGCCGTTPAYIRELAKHTRSAFGTGTHTDAFRDKRLGLNVKSQEYELPVRENEFYQLFNSGKKVIAVELDPPYNAEIDKIMECAHRIRAIGADIITIADSPMGRSRVDSILMSIKMAQDTGLRVMPHICCRDRNMIAMRSVLLGAYIHGIRNLLIVTGDPVPGENRTRTTGVFDYNSIQLMNYVKEMNDEHFAADPFYYGGALNHVRGNLDRIIERMQRKIDAGAAYFLTQPVYSDEDIRRIYNIKQRVNTRILCGIMPFVSYKNANFIKNELTGIDVPDEIIARYSPDMSRDEAEAAGAQIAREIIDKLDQVADGYYFMLPFNRVSLLERILNK